MEPSMSRSLSFALLAVPLLAAAAHAQAPVIDAMAPAEEACYGRRYDAPHLAANPRQSILEIYLTRLHARDEEREDEPVSREQSIANDRESEAAEPLRRTSLQIMASLREPRGRYGGYMSCESQDGVAIRCGVDCDGGGLSARVSQSEAQVTFDQHGIRIGPGCGEGGNVMLGLRPGDRTVRLDRMPMLACVAARNAARPVWVQYGRPLRISMAERREACFSRRYDAAHLARVPNQQIVAIAVAAAWRPAENEAPAAIEVRVTTRLRDGRVETATGRCHGEDYAFVCRREERGQMRITRGPNNGLMIRARSSDAEEADAVREEFAGFLGLPVGAGDDVFRLDAAQPEACR
jgi:hypothetical protein